MGIYKQKFNPVSGQFNLVSSSTVMTFKEGVATASALPPTGNTQGDARIANDTGHLYIWDGVTWVDQGDIIDYPTSSGVSIIQDDTASLDPDETKIITHASDPLYKRVVRILSRLQTLFYPFFNPSTEPQYDYDSNKIEFSPYDGVQLKTVYGAEGMIAYYIFEDTVIDVLNGTHNATNVNGTFSTGIIDKTLVLNGTSAYMDIPNHVDFRISDPNTRSIAWEFWINTSTLNGEIMNLWNETNNRRSWKIYLDSGIVKIDISTDGTTVAATVSMGDTINDGNWHHVGIYLNDYLNGKSLYMYKDGVQAIVDFVPSTFTYPLFSNTIDPIRVGALSGTASNFLNASICELAIYRDFDMTQTVEMYSSVFQKHQAINLTGTHLSLYPTSMQNIKTNSLGQINTSDWVGIQCLNFRGNMYGNCEISVLLSVDNRTTWKKWNGSSWETALETDQGTDNFLLPLTKEEWALLFVPGTLDYILQLKTNDITYTPIIYNLYLINIKPGYMLAEDKISFSLISDTETEIRNTTADPNLDETIYDIKTNIIL